MDVLIFDPRICAQRVMRRKDCSPIGGGDDGDITSSTGYQQSRHDDARS